MWIYGDKSTVPSATHSHPPLHDLFVSPRVIRKHTRVRLEIEVLESKTHKSQMSSRVKSKCQAADGISKGF